MTANTLLRGMRLLKSNLNHWVPDLKGICCTAVFIRLQSWFFGTLHWIELCHYARNHTTAMMSDPHGLREFSFAYLLTTAHVIQCVEQFGRAEEFFNCVIWQLGTHGKVCLNSNTYEFRKFSLFLPASSSEPSFINSIRLSSVDSVRYLWPIIDKNLKWSFRIFTRSLKGLRKNRVKHCAICRFIHRCVFQSFLTSLLSLSHIS